MSDLPSGQVTFLMTDIEGSTALWEQYPDEMPEALSRHDELLREVVTTHRGCLIKSRGEGDSSFSVFAEAANAVQTALAVQLTLQRETWGLPVPIRLRLALHSGHAELRGDDYFGGTVNRCARLRATAHGGQIVLSRATADLVRDRLPQDVLLNDLGQHRLRDLIDPEHVFELRHPALGADFPPLRSLDLHRHNLPLQPVPLVGREKELARIREMILNSDVRLMTLIGPGGIGKTRLALQAAADLSDLFDGGVFFIGLAATSDPALVLSAIVQTLGLSEVSGRALPDVISDFLRDKNMLLVLDNFEQVLPAAPEIASLLQASSGIKFLVTSRSVLHVTGEHVYPVPTLALPPRDARPDLDELASYEAVRLFDERARAVKPDFAVTRENATAIQTICHHLDGLPLAIELAAARVRLLTPQAMVRRLSRALPLLTSGARDVPTRQQTLRSAIAWSYDLLNPSQQALFRRLSVFTGGASIEAIEAVIVGDAEGNHNSIDPGGGAPDIDLLDEVAAIVDASLLEQRETDDGEPRFRMLEVIREFGREQLSENGEEGDLCSRHAAYFFNIARMAEPHLQGPDQSEWFTRLSVDHDNLRAALTWYRAQDDHEPYLHLAGALFWFWFGHGFWSEAFGWYEDALARFPSRTRGRATALYGSGLLCRAYGDYQGARDRFQECIEISREVSDQQMIARALHLLGGVATSEGDPESASKLLGESLEIAKAIDDAWTVAVVMRDLGGLASHMGDEETARGYLEESVRIHRVRGERWAQAHAQNALGDFMRSRARFDEAREAYEASLQLFSDLGTTDGRPSALHNLAYVALNTADVQSAAIRFRQALSVFQELGDQRGIAECLVGFGGTLTAAGRPRDAARLFGAAETVFEESGTQITTFNERDYVRNRELAMNALGSEDYARLRDAGRSMTQDEAVHYVLSIDINDFEPPEP